MPAEYLKKPEEIAQDAIWDLLREEFGRILHEECTGDISFILAKFDRAVHNLKEGR
ncbi:MAG TPA: hypothetical protein VJQ57_13815 [Acidimicrobiia bacterium]|nr:hypothetical protein [Acidimicrobiia bacterium]